jgi:hypothetical protein
VGRDMESIRRPGTLPGTYLPLDLNGRREPLPGTYDDVSDDGGPMPRARTRGWVVGPLLLEALCNYTCSSTSAIKKGIIIGKYGWCAQGVGRSATATSAARIINFARLANLLARPREQLRKKAASNKSHYFGSIGN